MSAPDQRSDAKRRLLEKFLRGEVSRQTWDIPIEPRVPGTPSPLAPGQHLIYLSALVTATEPVYNAPITIHRRGPIDPEILQLAFNEVIRRHEILRTTFASVDGQVVQAIHDRLAIQIPFLDLSELPPDRREAEANRVAVSDARRLFDLGIGPLIRARLAKIEPEYYRIYVTVHHIVFDGVSIYNVLLPELAKIYEAFADGQPSPLEEPRYQYTDFALWQKRLLENDAVASQIEYWRGQLTGELPDLQLPSDRPRPSIHSYRGGAKAFVLPPELIGAVKIAAAKEGVTVYMFLLTAFKALLHRYSGQEDIMLGGVSGARRRPEFQRLMGNFSNFFVLRTHPLAQTTFREYLVQVKDKVLGALANVDVPLDHVVRIVEPKRQSPRRPFFQAIFSMEPLAAESAGPNWVVTQQETETGFTKFDLYFEIDERVDGMFARFNYSADLFDPATIDRMIGHWFTLLEAAIAEPVTALGNLPILTPAEETQLVNWNNTRREIPPFTLHQLFEQQVALAPKAIAVEAAGVQLTYQELNQRANRLARRLRLAGVNHGTLVALCVDRTIDLAVAPLAIWKAGGVYQLQDRLKAPLFLTTRVKWRELQLAASTLVDGPKPIFCDELEGDASNLEAVATPETVAYSPGKGIEINHRALVNLLTSLQREPGFTAADSLLAVSPVSLDFAQLELFLPLISGGRLVIASQEETRDPKLLATRLRASKCTVLQTTPSGWRDLLSIGWPGQSKLRGFSTGEPLPWDLARHLLSRVAELWNVHGRSETAICSTVHRVVSSSGPVPIGHPIANTQIQIRDAHGKLAPVGVGGEMFVNALRTGDRARWLPDGSLEYLGRTDDEVNIRGHRVNPAEIESALLAIDRVDAAAVRAWTDESGRCAIAAYTVGTPSVDLRRSLQQKLPAFMIPEHFEVLDALPLYPGGQIDRAALPSPSAIENAAESMVARNELERRLTAIWESVLDARPIGIEDNFFDLGGHSFQVAKLLRKIEIEFGSRLSMAAVFEAPTISLLAKLLSDGASIARVPRATTLQPAGALEPLIWVYGGPLFRTLAQTLGKQRPFVGVDLDHDDEGLENAPFAEFATRLVRTIRDRQPHGPYYLGGWCISGLLAYEIASQLIEAGEKVGLVVMIDAPNPAHYFKIPKIALLKSKAAYHLKRLLRTQIGDLFPYILERAKGLFTHVSNHKLEEESPLQKALSKAAVSYDPKPIPARVLDIQPLEHPEIWNLRESWAPHLKEGNFEIREVPGDHVSMLEEPHVAALAACIKNGLRDNIVEIRQVG